MAVDPELRLAAEQVVTALYKGILGRAPDEGGLSLYTRLLREGGSLEEIVQAFVGCPESKTGQIVSLGDLDALPRNPIEFDLSPEQRETIWQHVAKAWSRLGEDDPYYSVLTADAYHKQNMSPAAVEQFYDSGKFDIIRAEKYLARNGLRLPQAGCCVDYGCGLGRMTLWLAKRCERVIAVDVSATHLNMARDALTSRGITNVEFCLLRRRSDLSVLRGADFFHSVIVLQHNPPPIIADILEHAFDGLNRGGSAFFQVPTYALNYQWNYRGYVEHYLQHDDMEMHVVPQSVVFSLAARAGCSVLEVQPDGCTGSAHHVSNTFLFVKPATGDGG